jgi:hypothetical protein
VRGTHRGARHGGGSGHGFEGGAGRGEVVEVATPRGKPGPVYLRWRILLRIRRFFRPTLRRPLRFFIRLTRLS